jgi:hypothetical protein
MTRVLETLSKWLDSLSYPILVPLVLALGLAPFVPEPHLVEKTRMLFAGELTKPIDIFDIFMHGTPALVLLVKIRRDLKRRSASGPPESESDP